MAKPAKYWSFIAIGILCGALHFSGSASAQVAEPTTSTSTEKLLEEMNQRLESQEKEIADLKAKLPAPTTMPSTEPASASAAVESQLASQQKQILALQETVKEKSAEPDSTPTYPTLQFHGFGDITYHASDLKGDKNSVTLGEFDFFVTSQIASDMTVLSETVISADSTNFDSIEIERLMFSWTPSDYFNVDVGRYHTSVGYYNTAFHHGTWFQNATNRPFIDEYEDSGGVIPAHSVGMSLHGNVPGDLAAKLGLGYFAEWGNGHQYQSPTSSNSVVANVLDDNNYKAFNLALIARPEALPGLQFGAGFYHDTLSLPGVTPYTQECFYHGHIVYNNADWELMAEGYAINHTHSGLDAWSWAYFLQIAHKMGTFTPYARFTYFDSPNDDPAFALQDQSGRHYGPAVGVRWDFTTFAALKVEYDYMVNKEGFIALNLPFQTVPAGDYSEIQVQLSFTY